MQSPRWWRALMVLSVLGAAAAGCGDDGADDGDPTEATPQVAPDDETDATGPEAHDGDETDLPEVAPPEPSGEGRATLTIGDETWEFAQAVCVFGPEQIGDPDAEFVLSAIEDGLQLYATIDGFGHAISIDDIEDFDDPRVSWSTPTPLPGDEPVELITIEDDQVSATASFTSENNDEAEGTLVATCA